jgi:hypothetical protein
VSLEFESLFSLESRPEWIRDKGTGQVKIDDLKMSLHLTPYNKKGKIQVDFSDAMIDINDYTAVF